MKSQIYNKIEIKKLDENSPILQRTQSTASQVKPVFNQTRLNESHTVIPNHDLPNPNGSIKEFANLKEAFDAIGNECVLSEEQQNVLAKFADKFITCSLTLLSAGGGSKDPPALYAIK